MSVLANVESVRRRVGEAAGRVGRDPADIQIVAVTKQVSLERIKDGVTEAGLSTFGENKAQELLTKFEALGGQVAGRKISWHFVGHLQSNKVRRIIAFVDLVHSLDRMSLAQEIDRRAGEIGRKQAVLVQVNVAGEAQKSGVAPADMVDFIGELRGLEHLEVQGLMTMAPYAAEAGASRLVFRELAQLFAEARRQYPGEALRWLSMGMTGDFEVAIEEGSNMVRIGTAIFGRRELS